MPSLINPTSGTDIAANYRKSFAPFTLFGTRQLRFYNIYINGLNVNHGDNGGDYFAANAYENEFGGPDGWDSINQRAPNYGVDSAFARVMASIQTQAEIYGVFHPDSDSGGPGGNPGDDSYFTVMVAGDTHSDRQHDYNFGNNSMTLQDTIYDALQGTSCSDVSVYEAFIAGDYMDRYASSSFARSENKPQLSQEEQSAVDALKAAQAALRALRKGK
jgi:hypothetical protein